MYEVRKLPIFIILSCLGGLVMGLSINATAEESKIPSWIKNTAKWWAEGQVRDSDFINALQWLMDNGILKTPKTLTLEQQMEEKMLESMLKDKGTPPLIDAVVAHCDDIDVDGDAYYTIERVDFEIEIINHDKTTHSPIIEIQRADDYDRAIKSSTIKQSCPKRS